MSFYQYRELRILNLNKNKLIAIEDGTFDNSVNLEELRAIDNYITYLPQSFGMAANSLRIIHLQNAFSKNGVVNLNFTQCIKLP